jgi:hypothetical protein
VETDGVDSSVFHFFLGPRRRSRTTHGGPPPEEEITSGVGLHHLIGGVPLKDPEEVSLSKICGRDQWEYPNLFRGENVSHGVFARAYSTASTALLSSVNTRCSKEYRRTEFSLSRPAREIYSIR